MINPLICPLMSKYDNVVFCRENCALCINNQCAIAIQAKNILDEQNKIAKPNIQSPLNKS